MTYITVKWYRVIIKLTSPKQTITVTMNATTTLIYDTLKGLSVHTPEQHAQIRQALYEQLSLPFNKQLTLYASVLGPFSSGKLSGGESIDKAVSLALEVLQQPSK